MKMSHVPAKGLLDRRGPCCAPLDLLYRLLDLYRCFKLFKLCGRHTHDVRFRKRLLSGGEFKVGEKKNGNSSRARDLPSSWPRDQHKRSAARRKKKEKNSRGGHCSWTERPISSGTRDSWSLNKGKKKKDQADGQLGSNEWADEQMLARGGR